MNLNEGHELPTTDMDQEPSTIGEGGGDQKAFYFV
jgi:hypothetical protein